MIVLLTSNTRTIMVYHREPIFLKDEKIDQRIKGTLGITG